MGDLGSIPGLGRSPEKGKGYLIQHSGLENSVQSMGSQKVRHDCVTFTRKQPEFSNLINTPPHTHTCMRVCMCIQGLSLLKQYWACLEDFYSRKFHRLASVSLFSHIYKEMNVSQTTHCSLNTNKTATVESDQL